ncbi:hypothetical protein Taro_043019, partial [Colocasia esculenta]|nr:hypothetical protein [Colocasia esculenta]
STSLEFTTSQRQADNNHRRVSQHSTSGATRHTKHLLSSASRAQRTTTHRYTRPNTQQRQHTPQQQRGSQQGRDTFHRFHRQQLCTGEGHTTCRLSQP